jgi:hypothetical protein
MYHDCVDCVDCGLWTGLCGLWFMDRIVWTGQQDTGLTDDVKKCLAVRRRATVHG